MTVHYMLFAALLMLLVSCSSNDDACLAPARTCEQLVSPSDSVPLLDFRVEPQLVEQGVTFIEFRLEQPANVELQIFEMTGRIVYTRNECAMQGDHILRIDLTGFPLGVYVMRAATDKHVVIKKLVIDDSN